MTAELSPRNGNWAVAISYRTAPNENRSVRVSNSFARACSGDIYATVPTVEPGLVKCASVRVASFSPLALDVVTLARPKSRILAWPRLVTKMLAGLMSRCTMPSAWAASSASAISMANESSVSKSSGRTPITCFSVWPSRNSIAMKASPCWSSIS